MNIGSNIEEDEYDYQREMVEREVMESERGSKKSESLHLSEFRREENTKNEEYIED